jgi:hypothetical protein
MRATAGAAKGTSTAGAAGCCKSTGSHTAICTHGRSTTSTEAVFAYIPVLAMDTSTVSDNVPVRQCTRSLFPTSGHTGTCTCHHWILVKAKLLRDDELVVEILLEVVCSRDVTTTNICRPGPKSVFYFTLKNPRCLLRCDSTSRLLS